MKNADVQTTLDYISQLPTNHQPLFQQMYDLVEAALRPIGYVLDFTYKMPTFSVPLSLYPQGYLKNPMIPLPYVSIAAQKHHVSVYHYGLYADPKTYEQFLVDYQQVVGKPADIGKSCIRFKYHQELPEPLLRSILTLYNPKEFFLLYQSVNRK